MGLSGSSSSTGGLDPSVGTGGAVAVSAVSGGAFDVTTANGLLGQYAARIAGLGSVHILPPILGNQLAEISRLGGILSALGRLDPDLPIIPDPPADGEFRVMIGGTEFPVTAGSTVYVGSTASVNEGRVRVGLPALNILEIHASASAAPGAGETVTVTVRRNGADTGLACVISGAATSASASGSITYTAGADFSVAVSTSSGAAESTVGFSIKTQFGS